MSWFSQGLRKLATPFEHLGQGVKNLVVGPGTPSGADNPNGAEERLARAFGSSGDYADTYERDYMNAQHSFDPSAAFKEYAQGAYGDFKLNLGKELRDLAGKSVGAGRLDTGFFDEDQGQVVNELGSRFVNDLNSRALDTAGMRLSQINSLGNHSLAKSDEYLSLITGQLDRDMAERNSKRQYKSDFANGLLRLGGSIAGAIGGGGG